MPCAILYEFSMTEEKISVASSCNVPMKYVGKRSDDDVVVV